MKFLFTIIFSLHCNFCFAYGWSVVNSDCSINGAVGSVSIQASTSSTILNIAPIFDNDLIAISNYSCNNSDYGSSSQKCSWSTQTYNVFYPNSIDITFPPNTITTLLSCTPPSNVSDPLTIIQPPNGLIQVVSNDNFSYYCGPTQSDPNIYWGCGDGDGSNDSPDDQYCCCDDDGMNNCGLGTWTPVNYTLAASIPVPESVSINVTPNSGYEFQSLTVDNSVYTQSSITFVASYNLVNNTPNSVPINITALLVPVVTPPQNPVLTSDQFNALMTAFNERLSASVGLLLSIIVAFTWKG